MFPGFPGTNNCWFLFLVTLVGMCVVDLYHLCLNKRDETEEDGLEE